MQTEMVDTTKNDARASKALDWANGLTITTTEDYRKADATCKALYTLRKDIEADFAESERKADEAKRAATAAKEAIVAQKESHTLPVQQAERICKTKMLAWSDEQEAIRRKEQDRLRELARQKAEDDQLTKAASLEAQGRGAAAEAVLAKPTKAASVVLAPAPVERETTISEYWSYKITEAVEVKREFCKPDAGAIQTAMNLYKKQGKTTEEAEALIGGIRIEKKVK